MRNNFFLLNVLIIVVFVSSCSRRKQTVLLPELDHAEAIMYQYPDSALRVLEKMQMPKSSDRLNHATWCLFLAQAKYKNYIKQPSDSLINIAYNYFMEQDNPQRKALALYLEGAINAELDDVEKATQFYLKAISEVERTTDYQLGHLIYVELGQIYIYRRLYDYAKEMLDKSYDYAELSENGRYIANTLLLLGRIYSTLKDLNRAIEYYQKAIEVARADGDEKFSFKIMLEMSDVYIDKGDYKMALKYAQKGVQKDSQNDLDSTVGYAVLGDIYRLIGNTDSAYYYLNKAIRTENVYAKRATYEALYYLSNNEKRYEEVVEYGRQLQVYTDSIQKIDRANAIVEIQEKYNKEKLLNEKNQLKIEKDRTLRTALLILIILLCAIAIIIYNYQHRLLQKERMIQKKEKQLRLYTLKVRENEVLMSRNEIRIQELSVEIEQNQEIQELLEEQKSTVLEIQKQNEVLHKENETLQRNISHYSSTLQEKSKELKLLNVLTEENLRLQDRERFLSSQLLKRTKILNDLKVSPKYLDFARWEEIKEAIDWLYENYTKRLMKKLPSLTESDLQICCLIKLHLAIPEIATLLGISSTSVSKRKLRLKERIVQELGNPLSENKTLDLWLWEY